MKSAFLSFIFLSIPILALAAAPIRLPIKTENIRRDLDLGSVVGLHQENAFFSRGGVDSSDWRVSRLRPGMNPEEASDRSCEIPYYEGAGKTWVTFFGAWSQRSNYKYDEFGVLTVGSVKPLWRSGGAYNFVSYINPSQGTCSHAYFPEGPLLHGEQRFILGFYQTPRGYVAISNHLATNETLVSLLDKDLRTLKEVAIPVQLQVLAAASDISSDELFITFFDENLWRVKLANGAITSVRFPGMTMTGVRINGDYALLANGAPGLAYTLWHLPTGKAVPFETQKKKLDYAVCAFDFSGTTVFEACHPWIRHDGDPVYYIDYKTLALRTYDAAGLMPPVRY